MCDPASIGIGGVMAGATLYSATQQRSAGKSQEKYYQFLAGLSEKNREEALEQGEENAMFAQSAGIEDLKTFQKTSKEFVGTQKAIVAAAGVQGGTAEDIFRDTSNKIEMDKIAIQYNTELNIYNARRGALIQGNILGQQAAQYRYQGSMSRIGGDMASYGTLLSGGAQTALTTYDIARRS